MHQDLIMGAVRYRLSGVSNVRSVTASDHAGGNVGEAAEHLAHAGQSMSQRNAEHRCTVAPVIKIGMGRVRLATPFGAAPHEGGREDLANIAIGDELAE